MLLAEPGFNTGGLLCLFLGLLVGVAVVFALLIAGVVLLLRALRSENRTFLIVAGATLLSLGLAPVVLVVWKATYDPAADQRRLTAAGFNVPGILELEGGLFSRIMGSREPKQLNYMWQGDKTGTDLAPEELVRILRRHPELERVALKNSTHPKVLQQLALLPSLESVHVETSQLLADDWTEALPPNTSWTYAGIRAPGLTPDGVLRILERCPELFQLGVPRSAVDDRVADAIIAHPTIENLRLYEFDERDLALPESEPVARLRRHIEPERFKVLGPGME
jgi:hypothetical protein